MATTDRPRPTVACPECGAAARRTDTETVCPECGIVLDAAPIDHGPERRGRWDPETGENPDRTRPADRALHDRGLGSEIDADAGLLERRRKWHDRAKTDKRDRTRGYATGEIHRMATALGWGNDLRDQAKRLFVQVHERATQEGRNLDALAAGAVYAVARVHQRGLVPGQVAAVARTEQRALTRRYADLTRTLDLDVPPPDPERRLRVVAREADVPEAVRDRALQRLDAIPETDVYAGSPSTLAAALLWVCGEDVTQATVAAAADCTPNGLRKRLDELDSIVA